MEDHQNQIVSISIEELNSLLEQHSIMKSEIENLKLNLAQCENKWNKIVRTTLRENVELKNENKILKERAKQLESTINATFSPNWLFYTTYVHILKKPNWRITKIFWAASKFPKTSSLASYSLF